MVKAVLFDIDGTLLKGGANKTHLESFRKAFMEIYGIDKEIDVSKTIGKTDKGIIVETLKSEGVSEDEIYAKIEEAMKFMGKYFRENFKKEDIELIKGVKELLSQLKRRDHILGLLSGNLEKIAQTKIEYVELSHLFDVESFGNISEVRSDLVKDSMRKIKYINPELGKEDVYIVDDAVQGIEAGNYSGVKTIAMATSRFSVDELKRVHPTYVFSDFSDTEAIIKTIEE